MRYSKTINIILFILLFALFSIMTFVMVETGKEPAKNYTHAKKAYVECLKKVDHNIKDEEALKIAEKNLEPYKNTKYLENIDKDLTTLSLIYDLGKTNISSEAIISVITQNKDNN